MGASAEATIATNKQNKRTTLSARETHTRGTVVTFFLQAQRTNDLWDRRTICPMDQRFVGRTDALLDGRIICRTDGRVVGRKNETNWRIWTKSVFHFGAVIFILWIFFWEIELNSNLSTDWILQIKINKLILSIPSKLNEQIDHFYYWISKFFLYNEIKIFFSWL